MYGLFSLKSQNDIDISLEYKNILKNHNIEHIILKSYKLIDIIDINNNIFKFYNFKYKFQILISLKIKYLV